MRPRLGQRFCAALVRGDHGRILVVVVIGPRREGKADLLLIVRAGRALGLGLGFGQGREKQRRQDGNDGDDTSSSMSVKARRAILVFNMAFGTA